jgi:hypothetical protein
VVAVFSHRIPRGYALDRRREAVGGRTGLAPWRRIGLLIAGWILLLAVSCKGTFQEIRFQEQSPDMQAEQTAVSLGEAEFRFAMTKLENGDFDGARETLTGIAEREDNQELAAEAAFGLGVLKLLEMKDLTRMRSCRDYFQAFADQHPGGPYRENAERIVQVLNSHIQRARKERMRIKALTEQVSEQEKTIQTLQYKIEKLEEIHRETEQKRHLLDGE